MFQHTTSFIGRFERHTFFNEKINSGFSIIPERGAILLDTIFNGKNVVEGFTSEEEIESLKWGKSIMLYPFPNRMCDGAFELNGKRYEFPLDNAATNNAIHGFGKNRSLDIKAVILATNYVSVVCVDEYDGSLPYFPFACRFEITYTFSENDGMEIEMIFTNESNETIPAGIGWHPYFSLTPRVDETSMAFNGDLQLIEINDRMLPTGKKMPYQHFQSLEKISETNLDNGFRIVDESKNFEVILTCEEGNLTYWQETGQRKYNFIQIFTPPHRTCVALEPMTCNIDAFNNKDGLVMLENGQSIGGKFGYKFS